ncbi:unnamed protein product [Brachionus calyciflorus]|uniref:Uncharacterized protein n=1 Tax=Brachionus calyciflorus TaxID=104777 RepID=A0A814F443_9BILA|nr:unnamed protein product [Brachionus calyciflorus]
MLKNFCRNFSTTQKSLIVKEKILDKLNAKYGVNLFEARVNNLSWKHDEPKDSEKYLEVIVVTPEFEGVLKSKRNDIITNLLKEETKGCEVTYKLLTPSKWYDSNQRGLKLPSKYSDPIISPDKLKEIAQSYYKPSKTA